MTALLKIILGTWARHWLAGFLTLLVARHFISKDLADSLPLDSAISNDYVFDAGAAAMGALLPFLQGVVSRMRSKLKERLALYLPRFSKETTVKSMIADAPLTTRIAATLTADPQKIIDAPSVAAGVPPAV